MFRKKTDSKRRWIARAKIGQFIPHAVIAQYPALLRRIEDIGYCYRIQLDGWARDAPFTRLNRMLAEWQRKRWIIRHLAENPYVVGQL